MITPLWVALVVMISVYANRQRAMLRGMARIHIVMIVAWAVLWALVLLGSFACAAAVVVAGRRPGAGDSPARRSTFRPAAAGAVTTSAQHPRHGLDEVIHAPSRFSIMATLSAVEKAEFAFVRDRVEISDSVLSKQASPLEQAGYVKIKKGYVGKRPAPGSYSRRPAGLPTSHTSMS